MATSNAVVVVSAGDVALPSLTPQCVADEMQVVSVLRQELRNSHEDHDGTAHVKPPAEPAYRTVDAKALRTLKFPSYPFIICEEAPSSYQAPIPYNLEGVVEVMREQVQELEYHLRDKEKTQSEIKKPASSFPSTRGKRSKEEGKPPSEDPMQMFIDVVGNDACFADVSREVSVVRWYTRWVASHSLCALKEAAEQLEYVLREGGMPTEAEMEEAMRRTTFVEAVSRLEKDRNAVIEAERRRMRSSTYTFREQLPASAITAATSSFLTPEEKYSYQEYYNQSQHTLMLLNHAMHVHYASRGREPSLVYSREGSLTSGSSKPSSLSLAVREADMEDVRLLSDTVVRALRKERDSITKLLQKIHERQESGATVGVTREQYAKSRMAAMAVYKCLLEDIDMLHTQIAVAAEFLMDYDGWIEFRCGASHEVMVQQLADRTQGATASSKPLALESRSALNISPPRDRSLSSSNVNSYGQLPRHVEELCEALMTLLRLSTSGKGVDGTSTVRETIYRRWMCLALRYTCLQVVEGRWPADVVLAGMDDIASSLTVLLSEYNSNVGAAQSHVAELIGVLRCFLSLVADGAVRRRAQHGKPAVNNGVVSTRNLDIPVAFRLDKEIKTMESAAKISGEDEDVWGAIFDALWFQADPTSCSHGGFLMSRDFAIDTNKGFGFLRLDEIKLPERILKTPPGQRRSPLLYLHLQYVIQPADMSPARSLPQLMEDNKSSLKSTSVVTRYGYTRRVLYILSVLEQRQLLQDYACRIGEVDLVPLESIVYFSRQRDDGRMPGDKPIHSYESLPRGAGSSSAIPAKYVTVVGLLPPAAVQLMRYNSIHPGSTYPVSHKEGSSLTSLTLLIGNMLLSIASRVPPVLSEMYLMGETTRDQGKWEVKDHNGEPSRKGSAVAATKSSRSKGAESKALVQPILRTLDDYISSAAFEKMIKLADTEMGQPNNGSTSTRRSA
ncbi:hypothetical protein DQ04_00611120 [Trypanosoma grayi]|uniref:hypothetical protein n=1 Tax=Trypanosoma grayi TaxID=71804 RepID=UPI0004F48A66|nr:hypothetical protein DQ04_00611120 [Trypanosoma grayi]KEG14125.1 hypothetical protein DQ04_00611120 [Trypanosoma grayi]